MMHHRSLHIHHGGSRYKIFSCYSVGMRELYAHMMFVESSEVVEAATVVATTGIWRNKFCSFTSTVPICMKMADVL